jgi:predicted nuclease of predicted toxin-antitoxin system
MNTPAVTIRKLLPRLASNHDGEVVATARAIDRLLKSSSLDWHDLASALSSCPAWPMSDWRSLARFCADNDTLLTERELDFLATLARWRGNPTEKQLNWLRKIAERLREAA